MCREELIDVAMERSVARMQAVIELARVIRDRKVMPVKVGKNRSCDCHAM